MKLVDEHVRSYMDDPKDIGLLRFLTWKGNDVAAAWRGGFMPATHLDDAEMVTFVKFNRDHYLYYLALIERYVDRRGKVLDIGCGTGARTALLARYADHVSGVDADYMKVMAAAHLNGDGNVRIAWFGGDFMEWEASQQFDYVFAVEVIEHIPRERHPAFIEKACGLLNPGGRLLITTPRDRPPVRQPPHIGLWDDADAQCASAGGELSYFDHCRLLDGKTSPWSPMETATHYVVMVQK